MFSGVLCFLWAWASSDIDTLLPMPYCHIFTKKCDWFPWVSFRIWSNVEFRALQHFHDDPARVTTIEAHKSWLRIIYIFSLRSPIYKTQSPNLINFIIGFLEEEKMVTNSLEHQIFVHRAWTKFVISTVKHMDIPFFRLSRHVWNWIFIIYIWTKYKQPLCLFPVPLYPHQFQM